MSIANFEGEPAAESDPTSLKRTGLLVCVENVEAHRQAHSHSVFVDDAELDADSAFKTVSFHSGYHGTPTNVKSRIEPRRDRQRSSPSHGEMGCACLLTNERAARLQAWRSHDQNVLREGPTWLGRSGVRHQYRARDPNVLHGVLVPVQSLPWH